MTTAESSSQPDGRLRLTSAGWLSLAFLLIFTAAALVAGLTYPQKAATMPVIIGTLGGALSLLQLIRELRASRAGAEEPVKLRQDLPTYAWVWGFVLAIVAFGFLYAAPVVLFAYLRFRSRESWLLSLLLSGAVIALLYGVFQLGLGVQLFDGLLTPEIVDWLGVS